jgi:transposase
MPRHKGKVERGVGYVENNGLKGLTFETLQAENEHLLTWETTVADTRIHGTTRQRPLDRFQRLEVAALRPLPPQPFEVVTWTQAKVARDCHVQVARTLYSVPYRYIGKTLAVRITVRTVEFYLDEALVKTHRRAPAGHRQTDWQDYPTDKARFFQRSPDWCREQARTLGPAVSQVVAELLASHALHHLRQCQGIIGLAEKYGAARLDSACRVAIAFGDPAYRTVRNILEKGLEGQAPLPLPSSTSAADAAAFLHGPEQLFAVEANSPERKDPHG